MCINRKIILKNFWRATSARGEIIAATSSAYSGSSAYVAPRLRADLPILNLGGLLEEQVYAVKTTTNRKIHD